MFANPVFITPGRYTMSSANALPSAPLERIYPELPPDNFRLSRIGDVKKQISEEIENYRKVAKKYKKAHTAITTPLSVWALSRPLSQPLATPLALYWPGIIVGAPLGAVGAFCGAGVSTLEFLLFCVTCGIYMVCKSGCLVGFKKYSI